MSRAGHPHSANDESALHLIGAPLAGKNKVRRERRHLNIDEFAKWAAVHSATIIADNVIHLHS
ncbi:hypothetical protein GCM10027278_18110 [Paralcaligenes ginsengisoli]